MSSHSSNDFHYSIYKLLNMTLSCRPSNPIDFAAVFFVDEQHVHHELAHALHQVRYFEEDKVKFREQVSAIFFSEHEKIEESLPTTDCIPLNSVVRVMKALYGENLSILTAILEYFKPGQYVKYQEFEDIVELTVICLNFATYLKVFLSDAFNKSTTADSPVSSIVTFQFIENAFRCLQDQSPLLPNLTQEDIADVKWKFRASSVLYAQDVYQQSDSVKLNEFLCECITQYFGFVTNAKNEMKTQSSKGAL